MTRTKNYLEWGPEQWQAFEQIKWEIVHAIALGPVQSGQDVKNVLYTAAGENGPTWSLWQKAPGETWGRPLGFWSQAEDPRPAILPLKRDSGSIWRRLSCFGSGWHWSTSPPSTMIAGPGLDDQREGPLYTSCKWCYMEVSGSRWSHNGPEWETPVAQEFWKWSEGKDFGISPEEEVTCAEETPLYSQLPENEKQYA